MASFGDERLPGGARRPWTAPPPPRHSLLLVGSGQHGWSTLRAVLHDAWGFRLVRDVCSAQEARQAVLRYCPDLIAVAVDVAGDCRLVRQLRDAHPEGRLIALGKAIDQTTAQALFRLGARAIAVWDDVARDELLLLLEHVARSDHVVLSRSVAASMVETGAEQTQRARAELGLSDREMAVLRGLDRGLTEGQIADTLQLGVRTVEQTVQVLKTKLHACNLAALAGRARSLHLLD